MGEYLSKVKTNVMTKEFVDPITKKKYDFQSHKEIDDYVNSVVLSHVKSIKHFEQQYKNDFQLLKAFDRYSSKLVLFAYFNIFKNFK